MSSQLTDVSGRSILITGGGSGIGAGTASYLANRGALVTISGRRADKLAQVAEQIGPACAVQVGDVTSARDRVAMIETAVAHGDGLDALVNNAGNMYRGALTELTEDQLQGLFNSNVIGAMLLSGLATPHLARRQGALVFLGSIHTRRAFPGVSPYAATKGAIDALTKSLAAELGSQGIRVNCVAPGAVFSEINQRAGLFSDEEAKARLDSMGDMHALGRIGEVTEIAQAIEYLITAPWTTGTTIEVDGGLALGLTKGF